jgi:hypothetical protein
MRTHKISYVISNLTFTCFDIIDEWDSNEVLLIVLFNDKNNITRIAGIIFKP